MHTPYDPVPNPAPIVANSTYHAMIERADEWIGRLVTALHAKGIWNDTLIVYSSGELQRACTRNLAALALASCDCKLF